MKNLKVILPALVVALMSGSVMANVGGESEESALMTTAKMEQEVFGRVQGIKHQYFNLKDETVTLTFFVNPKGDVAIESVEGESRLTNAAVVKQLQGQKMYVAPDLQNTRHTVVIRYVAP